MLRKKFEHGFNEQDWQKAKQEALEVLKARARRGDPITYSDLVEKVVSVHMDAHDVRLAHFLGEIAAEEHENGRPLITALVVHKHDGQPGRGFFELARSLNLPVIDELAFWNDQITLLKRQWA
jgi:hypothetical protein